MQIKAEHGRRGQWQNKTNEAECGSENVKGLENVKDPRAGGENSGMSPFLSALNTYLFCLVVNRGQLGYWVSSVANWRMLNQ